MRQLLGVMEEFPELLDAAFDYVMTGAPGSVLETLARALARDDVGWVSHRSRLDAAEKLFLRPCGWDPVVVRRLGAVQALIVHFRGRRRLPQGPAPAFFRALAWLTEDTAARRRVEPDRWMLNGPRCLQLLEQAGADQVELFAFLYAPFETSADHWITFDQLPRMRDLNEVLCAAPERTLQAARRLSIWSQKGVIDRLDGAGFGAYPPFQDFLYETALTSDELRDAAVEVFLRIPGGRALLQQRLQREQPGKRRTIQESLHRAAQWQPQVPTDESDGYRAISGDWIAVPPATPPPPDTPVPAGLEEGLHAAVREARELELGIHQSQRHEHALRQAQKRGAPSPEPPDPRTYATEHVGGLMDILSGRLAPSQATPAVKQLVGRSGPPEQHWRTDALYEQRLQRLLSRPGVTMHHLARLVAARGAGPSLMTGRSVPARLLRQMARAAGDLRPVLACIDAAMDDRLLRHLLECEPQRRTCDQPPLWQVIAAHLPLIDQALGLSHAQEAVRLNLLSALALLARLPSPPARYFDVLVTLAARRNEATGRPARALLATSRDCHGLILSFLRSPDAHRRFTAALWLRERQAHEAIPQLRAALDSEADATVRSGLLTTLARFGEPVIDALRAPALMAQARALLTSDPEVLTVLPLPLPLPPLTWSDGQAVAPELSLSWALHAHGLRDPWGDEHLHLCLDHLDRGSAGDLGMLTLRAFMDSDDSPEAARAYAQDRAEALAGQLSSWGPTVTRHAAIDLLWRQRAHRPKGVPYNRGILALLRRAPPQAIGVMRAALEGGLLPSAQRKEILTALAAHGPSPSPLILAFLYETATEHRRKGVRKQAQRVLQSLATARGWSDEELADRAMPRAGLDDHGRLALPRAGGAAARLEPDLTILIEDAQGRTLPKLPAECAEARDALAQLRRDIKKIAARQSARLEQAMMKGRIWRLNDFREMLLAHPITGRVCQHLIFAGLDDDSRVTCTFRPTHDGHFVDALGDPVEVAGVSGVRLIHRWLLEDPQLLAWIEHIGNFRVVTAFSQLQ